MNSSEANNQPFPRKVVYWERQANDKLCGLHCINSLIQGPLFDAFGLGEIAQKLDEEEKKLYGEDPELSSKPSGNVDLDGNFNIQVLSEALRMYEVELIPLKKHEVEKLLVEKYDTLDAFIFNSSTHWFSIRKIDNIWFNLNSTNSLPGPQIISDFYLSAFIKGTEELGYTNFLVKNILALPELDSEVYKNLQPHQKLVPIEDIRKSKPKKINMGDSDEQALERALELSKKEYEKEGSGFNNQDDFDIINNFGKNEDFSHLIQEGIHFLNVRLHKRL
jgi:ataxin-3